MDLVALDPPEEEEGAEILPSAFGDLLRRHRDARGVLVAEAQHLPPLARAASYASIASALAAVGRWLPNDAHAEGASVRALERREIPLPDVPRSRAREVYVLSPARAMRELGLEQPPLRVACSERDTALAPAGVVAFYAPVVKTMGFSVKRRVWSDGSAEQLVGHTQGKHVIVHAEREDGGRTFVRVEWMPKVERRVLATLEARGVPVLKVLAKGSIDGKPAHAVERFDVFTRGKPLEELAPILPTVKPDLLRIRAAVVAGLAINDLQLLLKPGRALVFDPLGIAVRESSPRSYEVITARNPRFLDDLLAVADAAPALVHPLR
jgi:hypothetical protein